MRRSEGLSLSRFPATALKIRVMSKHDAIELSDSCVRQSRLILDSYRHWLGVDLIARGDSPEEDSQRLYAADFVVVSHGTEADPILNYANQTAQTLWEADWNTLLQMPSRLTAEPMHRDERRELLDRVSRDGYIDDYQGIRIAATGQRFRIRQAVVWNLIDAAGEFAGQAATFRHWEFL